MIGQRLMQRPREAVEGTVLWETWPELLGTQVETAFRQALESAQVGPRDPVAPPAGPWPAPPATGPTKLGSVLRSTSLRKSTIRSSSIAESRSISLFVA